MVNFSVLLTRGNPTPITRKMLKNMICVDLLQIAKKCKIKRYTDFATERFILNCP